MVCQYLFDSVYAYRPAANVTNRHRELTDHLLGGAVQNLLHEFLSFAQASDTILMVSIIIMPVVGIHTVGIFRVHIFSLSCVDIVALEFRTVNPSYEWAILRYFAHSSSTTNRTTLS